ncbi:hypothetical protein B0H13DRAFT_1890717 [Mycena leptocephala]|nr:hypothetical protein B0H13DRAFT_1890717 [Mycena leptocephala]
MTSSSTAHAWLLLYLCTQHLADTYGGGQQAPALEVVHASDWEEDGMGMGWFSGVDRNGKNELELEMHKYYLLKASDVCWESTYSCAFSIDLAERNTWGPTEVLLVSAAFAPL